MIAPVSVALSLKSLCGVWWRRVVLPSASLPLGVVCFLSFFCFPPLVWRSVLSIHLPSSAAIFSFHKPDMPRAAPVARSAPKAGRASIRRSPSPPPASSESPLPPTWRTSPSIYNKGTTWQRPKRGTRERAIMFPAVLPSASLPSLFWVGALGGCCLFFLSFLPPPPPLSFFTAASGVAWSG